MLGKKKKIIICLSIIILFFSIFIIMSNLINNYNSYNTYDSISKYVNENYIMLEKTATEYIKENKVKKPKNINSISVYNSKETPTKNNNIIVEFYMNSYGFASSSVYRGFYYSKTNRPTVFQNSQDTKLIQYKNNAWKWKKSNDNFGKTIKIKDNWFYFEASF